MTNSVSNAPNQAWLDSPVDHAFVSSWLDDPHVREFIGDSFDVEKLPRGVNNKWAKAVYEQFDALPKGEGVSLSKKFAITLSGKNSELIQFLSRHLKKTPHQAWLDSPIDPAFISSWLDNPQVRKFIGKSFDVEKLPRGVNNKWAKAVCEQFDPLPKGEEASLSTKFVSVLSGKNVELIQFLSAVAGPESPIAKTEGLKEAVLEAIKERADIREDLIQIFSTHINMFLRKIAEDAILKWSNDWNEFAKTSLLEETKKFMDMFFSNANFKPQDADDSFLLAVNNGVEDGYRIAQIFFDKNIDKKILNQKTIGEAFLVEANFFINFDISEEYVEKYKKIIEILLRNLPPDDINIRNALVKAAKNGSLEFVKFLFNFDNGSLVQHINISKAFVKAAKNGSLEFMKFLFNFDNGSLVQHININEALIEAAKASKLEGMTFLFEDGVRVKIFNDININRIFVKAARAGYFIDSISDRWFIRDFLSVGPNAKITDETISNVLEQAIKQGFFEIAIDLLEAGARPGINFSIDDAIQEVTGKEGVRQGHRGGSSASDMIHYILAKWPGMSIPMEIPDTDL